MLQSECLPHTGTQAYSSAKATDRLRRPSETVSNGKGMSGKTSQQHKQWLTACAQSSTQHKNMYVSATEPWQQNDKSGSAAGLLCWCKCMLGCPHLPLLRIAVMNSSTCSGLPGPLLAGSQGDQAVQAPLLPLKPSSPLLSKPFGAALVVLWRLGHKLG